MTYFDIQTDGPVSMAFRQKGCSTFADALQFIKNLPYSRNINKSDLLAALNDGYGTCSTKHAALKALADENGQPGYKLMLGIFKMDGQNTPKAGPVLQQYGLLYMPEAHNYLRIGNQIIDCTNPRSSADDFVHDLLEEIPISPAQITDFKVKTHKDYLEKWRHDHTSYTLEELWNIREACIGALSG